MVQMETVLSLGVAINMTGKDSLDARKWFLISVWSPATADRSKKKKRMKTNPRLQMSEPRFIIFFLKVQTCEFAVEVDHQRVVLPVESGEQTKEAEETNLRRAEGKDDQHHLHPKSEDGETETGKCV